MIEFLDCIPIREKIKQSIFFKGGRNYPSLSKGVHEPWDCQDICPEYNKEYNKKYKIHGNYNGKKPFWRKKRKEQKLFKNKHKLTLISLYMNTETSLNI